MADLTPSPVGSAMTAIYRWNGMYFGFLDGGYLFDAAGSYVGWVTADDHVFRFDGLYLGELVEGEYVLRSPVATVPTGRPQMPRPPVPTPPPPETDRPPRAPRPGYDDGLDAF